MAAPTPHLLVTQLFSRKDDDGRPVYSPEQVSHAVVFVLMAGASPGLTLPPAAEEYLGRLGAQLGLRPDADGTRVATVMAQYFASHPLHPALRLELTQAAGLVTHGWADLARGLARALSDDKPPAWLPTMAPPRARVGAGPLARDALKKSAPSRKKKQ